MTTNFDVRTHNGTITITNTASGNSKSFRIHLDERETANIHGKELPNAFKGKRVVSVFVDGENGNKGEYRDFAFANEHGVKVWYRFRNTSEPVKYASMLNDLNRCRRTPTLTLSITSECDIEAVDLELEEFFSSAGSPPMEPEIGTYAATARFLARSGLMSGDEADAWKDEMMR